MKFLDATGNGDTANAVYAFSTPSRTAPGC
jgi:hypothetical protein